MSRPPSTQSYINISEIRDDVVIMKDGTMRAVLLVSSINFALKSEEEHNAIIQAYIQFLNSFDYPFQIVIQSRRLNIDDYLEQLKKIEKEQVNELLKIQTTDYLHFVSELLELAEIMTKRFYLVIPHDPRRVKKGKSGFLAKLLNLITPARSLKLARQKFEKEKAELFRRVEFAIEGLGSMGLSVVTLDTQGLIELYYNTYNPETYQQEKLPDFRLLNIEG